jgi:hypothetical protein
MEVHAAVTLPYEPNSSEAETATAKFKLYKTPDTDQIPAELIQTRGSEIHKLINSVWNKEQLPEQWNSLLMYQFTRWEIKLTVVIIVGYRCYRSLKFKSIKR